MKVPSFSLKLITAALLGIAAPLAAAGEKPRVLILATGADKMTDGKPTGLWLEEFAVPYNAFTKAGFDIVVSTPKGGDVPVDPRSKPTPEQTAEWADASKKLAGTVAIADVDASKLDAVFVPGGHGTMFDLATDEGTAKLLTTLNADGKIIAAVCHGPAALVGAKGTDGKPLVAGKTVATFTDDEERAVKLDKEMPFLLESKLAELGAKIDKKPNFTAHAVRDGNLITGQNPPSSELVADLVIKALAKKSAEPTEKP
ncbi:type 1 glutamine amidotransferase domain-containing protein [Luteolibacter flavescens]|uniref:Type 1 glutamine amidotransferase domain-containing protein n=1 Tax=Luteolibacter flavescens TaxID=1859460 RepID=A0ABT3FN37_9BACT|nr:type 1 glutamine amidotransferase domain-containing protein [Luteolibacter flavescens]MCW1884986.1 type 1 glutamine amidotransferase domain-containing protein [Luteolibacter flavescens]